MYEKNWGANQPGCLILLLDQSGSMALPFGRGVAGGGRRKCDMVATVLNGFLNELITINTIPSQDGSTQVRPRADICVLGYQNTAVTPALDGPLSGKLMVTLPELAVNPVNIEMRNAKEIDDLGRLVEISVPFSVWVMPKADGGTPMCAALQRACDLADQWARSHPGNYPPVIVNVTDGASTDGDPTPIAHQLCQISTADGQALLFNVHITEHNLPSVAYPASEAELPNDEFARMLFSISSEVPETSRNLLESVAGMKVMPGARGMIFNGDAASIQQMFTFASAPAKAPINPNM